MDTERIGRIPTSKDLFLRRPNMAQEQHQSFVEKLYDVIDNQMKGSEFAKFFDSEAIVNMGGIHQGHDAIAASGDYIFGVVSSLKHTVERITSVNQDSFVVEGLVTYVTRAGTPIEPLRFCGMFDLVPNTQRIISYRVYGDFTPLTIALTAGQ